MFEERNTIPYWLVGVVVALILIVIGVRMSGGTNPVLVDTFRPTPTIPGAPTPAPLELPQVNLPPEAQKAIDDLRNRFLAGETVPALTPQATSSRARVDVQDLNRQDTNLQVRGTVTNTSNQPFDLSASAFTFQDTVGTVYTIGGSGSTTLQPGQSAPFDLSVPLPEGRGLSLLVSLPPDPPIQQLLIAAPQ